MMSSLHLHLFGFKEITSVIFLNDVLLGFHSISEPSLFKPRHWAFLGEFSSSCAPLRRRAPSLPSCKTAENSKMPQQSYHQVYMHFSQPLRPTSKVAKKTVTRCEQKPTTERRNLQPLARHSSEPPKHETLSVRGKTCLLSQPLLTASAASRKELHIFLPAEGAEEEETRDSESVDEGFMDELDNKISTLALQHDPKIPKQSYVAEPLLDDVVQVTF